MATTGTLLLELLDYGVCAFFIIPNNIIVVVVD
jgi:hypothetical protein